MKKILATMISIIMILSLTALASAAATPTWTGTSGTAWAANGDDFIHASGTQDYIKAASTDLTYQDFTISGKIAVSPNGTSGGDDTFLILRDQGTTATGTGGAIVYSTGIRFVFRWGHFGIRNGAANVATPVFDSEEGEIGGADTGVNGTFITNVYAPSDVVQYIPFSITLDGDKITAMSLNNVDVTEYVDEVTLPVTAAGKISIGSFINPPSFEMGIKDVVITLKGETAPVVSESPSTGDANTLPVLGLVVALVAAAFVLTAKKVRA
jgi:hypothetical protein